MGKLVMWLNQNLVLTKIAAKPVIKPYSFMILSAL